MPVGPTFANDLMLYIFTDDPAPSLPASFWVSLHTGAPIPGNQTTNEATYTGYARVEVTRDATATGWTVTANEAVTQDTVTFPTCSGGGPQTITHFGMGTEETLPGQIIFWKVLEVSKIINSGDVPRFNSITGTLNVT